MPCFRALAVFLLAAVPAPAGELCAQNPFGATEHAARDAQRHFEAYRRERLPRMLTFGNGTDVTVGRFRTTNDISDTPPRDEPDSIRQARRRLRDSLAVLGASAPTSDFIVGQQVRYALEAHDYAGAKALLDHCEASAWWCDALSGLVYHSARDEEHSNLMFTTALALMPDTLRCQWLDVHTWLPYGMGMPSGDPPCTARAMLTRRVLWLSAPLLTWRPHAARDEFFARRTMERIVAGTAIPRAVEWGSDIAEIWLRYGWPVRYSREPRDGDIANPALSPVVEHLPAPGFSLAPHRHAIDAPLEAQPDDWDLSSALAAPMMYAPGWISSIGELPVQLARFRHGDSMVVVVAYDARMTLGDPPGEVEAAALLASAPDSTLGTAHVVSSRPLGALIVRAPAERSLVAVEVLDTARALAMRWRGGLEPLDHAALISDLLVGVADSRSIPHTLAAMAPHAVAELKVQPGTTLALFWEMYAHASLDAPVRVSLQLVPLSGSFLGRLGHLFGVSHPAPAMSLAWNDPGGGRGAVDRAVRLAIPDLPPGRYRLELEVANDAVHGRATRDIEVLRMH